MKNFIACVGLVVFCGGALFGQKQTTHVQQIWGAYLNQTRLSDKWGFWLDLQLRSKEDFVKDLSTGIMRAGITYYLRDNTRLTAGYAFVNHFPADDHAGISQPEHRPWQQIFWVTPGKSSRLVQYIRLEERYRRKIAGSNELADGYNFNFRARYSLLFMAPLSKKAFEPNTLSLALNDEIHVNFGKQIVNNYFDQNRFFAGFAYHVNKADNLQFGYMNLFQQLAAGNRYRSIHAIRVYYYHSLDLRKK